MAGQHGPTLNDAAYPDTPATYAEKLWPTQDITFAAPEPDRLAEDRSEHKTVARPRVAETGKEATPSSHQSDVAAFFNSCTVPQRRKCFLTLQIPEREHHVFPERRVCRKRHRRSSSSPLAPFKAFCHLPPIQPSRQEKDNESPIDIFIDTASQVCKRALAYLPTYPPVVDTSSFDAPPTGVPSKLQPQAMQTQRS